MTDQRNMQTGQFDDLNGLRVRVGADHDVLTIHIGTARAELDQNKLDQLRALLNQAESQAARNSRTDCSGPCCFNRRHGMP